MGRNNIFRIGKSYVFWRPGIMLKIERASNYRKKESNLKPWPASKNCMICGQVIMLDFNYYLSSFACFM